MEEKNKKERDEKTGSKAPNDGGGRGLYFLSHRRTSWNIRQGTEHIPTSFYTNTFNQAFVFCQGLDGVYERRGNEIKLSSRLLLKIQERNQIGKSRKYLSLYTRERGKLVFLKFISGLLEVKGKNNTYRFDCLVGKKKIHYLLELTPTTAKITRFLPSCTNRGKK
jgi:hypothetical protein